MGTTFHATDGWITVRYWHCCLLGAPGNNLFGLQGGQNDSFDRPTRWSARKGWKTRSQMFSRACQFLQSSIDQPIPLPQQDTSAEEKVVLLVEPLCIARGIWASHPWWRYLGRCQRLRGVVLPTHKFHFKGSTAVLESCRQNCLSSMAYSCMENDLFHGLPRIR